MRKPFLIGVLMLAACGGGGGGGADANGDGVNGPDGDPAPVFRNPVDLPDAELAIAALKILGANVPGHDNRCNGCHPLTRSHIRFWRTLSDTAMADCFTDLAVSSSASAHQTIDCFRSKPSNPSAAFMTPKIGVFASAARLPWFNFLFTKAYGGSAEYDAFVTHVGMPPGAAPATAMDQGQFDIVAEWFIRGVPMLDQSLPEDPPPDECFPNIAPDVAAHVADQAVNGWRAHNLSASLNMFGCGGATDPLQCLSSVPLASGTAFGATWDVPGYGTNRVLKTNTAGYSSAYWTRSSADGRFVMHGSGDPAFNSTAVDLQDGGLIEVHALYDPGFFPDNAGFVIQGNARNVCPMSVLQSATTDVNMNEPGCTALGSVDLYEHVGGLPGGDYFSIDGEFVSDNGGHTTAGTHRDPQAYFGSDGAVGLTPLIYTGSSYQSKPTVYIDIPFQGDTVISPSSKLMISRLSGPGDRQLGFVMKSITATPNGTSYDVSTLEVARYCMSGGKPAFSYDERWMVYHHYLSPTSDADAQDLGFADASAAGYAAYVTKGASNVYLLDIATGELHRITNMKAGQYALYPHFRSDGWIYYQVREPALDTEYTVATDGALLNE